MDEGSHDGSPMSESRREKVVFTYVLIAEAWPGDPMGGNQKKLWGRTGGGRGRRRQPVIVDDLTFGMSQALFSFLHRDPVMDQLPVLSRWCDYRDHYHRGRELEAIASELQEALDRSAGDGVSELMLRKMLSLVHRALTEGLVLVVGAES